jgi:myo-inositol-1(or 4)-monophosphatase
LAAEYAQSLAGLEVRTKGVQDVVTQTDLEVELLIKEGLKSFSADGFLGEETGSDEIADAEGIWVVDPIDGTQPFASGMASWCVSIAYVHRGELQFGFVYNPPLNELFEGGRGRRGLLKGAPIAPHPGQALTEGIVSIGYSPRIGVDDILPVFDPTPRSRRDLPAHPRRASGRRGGVRTHLPRAAREVWCGSSRHPHLGQQPGAEPLVAG